MPQIINTNIASLNAQRNLDTSQSSNTSALQRLSSGLRINSAKDDAAGLSISTGFSSQTRGLAVAIRNAGDGVSLAQTAEGALGAMTENLQRIRELAVQSSNLTNDPGNRISLQNEVEQRLAEIRRTAEETNFNGRNLLDGGFGGAFQIGANAGDTVDIQISELTTARLGASDQVGVSAIGNDDSIANGDLSINGVQIGVSSASDDSFSRVNASASGIAKAAAINRYSAETGVTAYANPNEVNGFAMSAANGATSATVQINGVDISLQSTANSTDAERASTRNSTIAAINAKAEQTGVTAVDGGDKNGVILVAENGQNIVMISTYATSVDGSSNLASFGLAMAATTGSNLTNLTGTNSGVYEGGYTLVADGATDRIEITGGQGVGSGDLERSGLAAGSYTRETAVYTTEAGSVVPTSAATVAVALAADKALDEGDLVINGVTIGASTSTDDKASDTAASASNASGSAIAIAAAINRASDNTGVKASVNETVVVGVTGAAPATAAAAGVNLDIAINGVDIGTVVSQGDLDKDRQSTINAINAKAGQTGVMAEDNGEGITLRAADGRNISVVIDGTQGSGAATTGSFGLDADVDGIGIGATGGDALGVFASVAETTYGTVRLESAGTIDIDAGSNGTAGLEDSGFARGEYGGGEDGQYLDEIDITTFEGAQAAITAIDNALETVNAQRSELGALQNRFESTISNLQITSENLTAANSRIRDADFAAETAELSRSQVLQQAGISVLAQANQRPQQVLSLLG